MMIRTNAVASYILARRLEQAIDAMYATPDHLVSVVMERPAPDKLTLTAWTQESLPVGRLHWWAHAEVSLGRTDAGMTLVSADIPTVLITEAWSQKIQPQPYIDDLHGPLTAVVTGWLTQHLGRLAMWGAPPAVPERVLTAEGFSSMLRPRTA